jgi:eukaryotic-like serine/threonine-protein kinase
MDERWAQISRIYNDAAALAQRDRGEFLRAACGTDDVLRAEVESLLGDNSCAERMLEPRADRVDLIGQRIGTYDITALLGRGGMGEVYRARDTMLGRDVAIKVLPAEFARDAERVARFAREARVLASLNHPHIGAIHGLEDASGVQALVLELVEGQTLAARLADGCIPVRDALLLARQIADALEGAHEHGIVHRDLKPSNIIITPDGNVKVLDFGLAKAALDGMPNVDATESGVVLGTTGYMSPEQARGKPVDTRTDIWAFGCVLYEMLTGRAAFPGESASDALAAILDREPDWSALDKATPPAVLHVLRRCIHKDPRRRLQHIGDARLELDDALAIPIPGTERPSNRTGSHVGRAPWLTVGVGLVIAVIVLAAAFSNVWRQQPAVETFRFVIPTPPMPSPASMAISPDGRTVAFTASMRLNDLPMLFVRRVGSIDSQLLPGTEGATDPFWSPDSRSIGFGLVPVSGEQKLKVIEVGEGRPRVLCDAPNFFGGTWNRDDIIVFGAMGGLYRVSSSGGTRALIVAPDTSLGEVALRWPQFLPDGNHVLYQAANRRAADRAIVVRSLDAGHAKRVMLAESNAAFAPPNFLLFTRLRTLMVQQFDPSTLTIAGDPLRLAENILLASYGRAAFAVSDAGMLAYRTGETMHSLVYVDRVGRVGDVIAQFNQESMWELSPDGKRVVFGEPSNGENDDVFIYDLERRAPMRLTNNPATDWNMHWSPDGSKIGFSSFRNGNVERLYKRTPDSAAPDELMFADEPGMHYRLIDWRKEFIIFLKSDRLIGAGQAGFDVWALPLSGSRKPFLYLPKIRAGTGTLSPNGRWFAYVAEELGRFHVIVQSFPDPRRTRQQVSIEPGSLGPTWSRDSRELFYVAPGRRIMAVSMPADGPLTVQKPKELFVGPTSSSHDVAADGKGFLFNLATTTLPNADPITVVLNWSAGLKSRD